VQSDLSPLLPHPFGSRFRHVVMIAAGGLFLSLWIAYWIVRLVQAKTLAGIANCPGCHSSHVEKTGDKSLADRFFRLFHCWPYRCYGCGTRYFRAG
jgi:hypothetical protein